MSTTVVNIRTLPRWPAEWPPDHVYIGRAVPSRGLRRSRWANRARIGPTLTRDQAIDAYEAFVRAMPHLLLAVRDLRGKTLVCWCHPERCRGDVLARLADAP